MNLIWNTSFYPTEEETFIGVKIRNREKLGRGGGQVVSVLDFYSNDPSSNPAYVSRFLCEICVWKERK